MNVIATVISAFGVALALAGCATSARVSNSNAAGVSIIFDGNASSMDRVNRLANSECAKYGRLAVMQGVTPVEGGRIATFECRLA